MLHIFINATVPIVVSICELMGITVIIVSSLRAFYGYWRGIITHKPCDVKYDLADGLATALEFKMAAEILKTVTIQSMEELKILGAVILIRALLAILIHFELKRSH